MRLLRSVLIFVAVMMSFLCCITVVSVPVGRTITFLWALCVGLGSRNKPAVDILEDFE